MYNFFLVRLDELSLQYLQSFSLILQQLIFLEFFKLECAQPFPKMEKLEHCEVIKYLYKKGLTPKQIHEDRANTLGTSYLSCFFNCNLHD